MGSARVQDLIVLVGHNPMPAYISVAALQPQRVHWVYSKETSPSLESLTGVIKRNWPAIAAASESNHPVEDAHSPRAVQKAMQGLARYPGSWLNYTGGTKVMTVHAHSYWSREVGGSPHRSFYVDGLKGLLRFDNGDDMPIGGVTITIDDLIALHGLVKDPSRMYSKESRIEARHWWELGCWAVDNPSMLGRLYQTCHEMRSKPKKAKDRPVDLRFIPDEARPDFCNESGWPMGKPWRAVEDWGKFLTGGWLEDLVDQLVVTVSDRHGLGLTVSSGIRPRTPELSDKRGQSELDVVAVRGYRTYLLSCTTSTDEGLVKSKCYEARNRVELIGGELAKAAVVCPAEPRVANSAEEKARVLWQGTQQAVKVFHVEDLREWLGGDHHTLVDWFCSN